MSHYFHARLSDQFDAILHYDHTRAVEPLEQTAEWEAGEVEETFPSGLCTRSVRTKDLLLYPGGSCHVGVGTNAS